jgi:DNA processing protein
MLDSVVTTAALAGDVTAGAAGWCAGRARRCTRNSTRRRQSLPVIETPYNRSRFSMQQSALAFRDADDFVRGLSPFLEMGAYEWLWAQPGATFKKLADRFRARPDALPSDFVSHDLAIATAREVVATLAGRGVPRFGLAINQTYEYPKELRDARHPVEVLYYLGSWNLVETNGVAVVGTRKPSQDALAETAALVRLLVAHDWTIVSGLAEGIDTQAHTTAFAAGGRTIGVIGTPICEAYPRANAELQRRIADTFLVVSQVPVLRYYQQIWMQNRSFFPERNITMSALTHGTIIVEASDTSGTLIQARAALQQGRKLFILDRCFHDPDLKWPHEYVRRGAVRVRDYAEIVEALGDVRRNR